MVTFTEQDIHYGAGVLEQALRSQTDIPGYGDKMTPGVAIDVLSAAMRSGVPADRFAGMIEQRFPSAAQLMMRLLERFEGNNWDIDLWHRLPTGRYKPCTELCRPGLAQWRYNPSARDPIE